MGHSSIRVTYDVYGHLFQDGDGDQAAMAALEASLRGWRCNKNQPQMQQGQEEPKDSAAFLDT